MIIKESKSGKAWVIVDDHGETYSIAQAALAALKAKTNKSSFAIPVRLPTPSEPGRFKKSPLLGKGYVKIEEGEEGWIEPQCPHNIKVSSAGEAGLSDKQTKKRESKKLFEDKKIEW